MILKLELDRAQAELNAIYEQIRTQFAGMEPPTAGTTLVDAEPCPVFDMPTKSEKLVERKPLVSTKVIGNLIDFDSEGCQEKGASNFEMEDTHSNFLLNIIFDLEEKVSLTNNVAVESADPGMLVDLSLEPLLEEAEEKRTSKAPCTSDDLAVLTTHFQIPNEDDVSTGDQTEETKLRDVVEVVQVISEGYKRFIGRVFEASGREMKEKDAKLEGLQKQKDLMGPLYSIGLAIRKRHAEGQSGKERKDKTEVIIAKGNSAAHHGQALADATWMMASPIDQEVFKAMYSGVDPKTVWDHREVSTFLDILNWNLDMRQFSSVGGVDKQAFASLFNVVFSTLYPSFRFSDEEIEKNPVLKHALANMQAEHRTAYERDRQTRIANSFVKKKQLARASR